MKKILIIGANGFLGANIASYFAHLNYEVTAFCHSEPQEEAWKSKMHRVIIGDVCDENNWNTLSEEHFHHVIYLVSLNHTDSEGNLDKVTQINLSALWKAAQAFADKTEKFLYLSTQQVYGRVEGNVMNENTLCQPANIYGLTHWQCEGILDYYNRKSNTNFISIRLSNCYGIPAVENKGCWTLVVNELCKEAVEKNTITLKSDGSPLRDFIYMEDMTRAMLILCNAETKHSLYNLSSGISYTIAELAQLVQQNYKKITGIEVNIVTPNHLPLCTTKGHLWVDNSRIKEAGLNNLTNINDGIFKLLTSLIKETNPL